MSDMTTQSKNLGEAGSMAPATASSASAQILERYAEFSPKQLQVARFLLDHEDLLPFLSVREVAGRAHVSTATVVRFCRELGYEGFANYQKDSRRRFLEHDTFVQRLSKRIETGSFSGDLAAEMTAIHVANIQSTLSRVVTEDLDRAVNAIINARTVQIRGSGLGAAVAISAEHAFSVLGLQASAITNGGLLYARESSAVTEEDVFIVIDVWRYLKDSVIVTRAAQANGAEVIALTDSPISPVASLADHVFVADDDGLLHSRSQLGFMSLVHLLSSAVAAARPEESLKALEKLDESYHRHGLFWDSKSP